MKESTWHAVKGIGSLIVAGLGIYGMSEIGVPDNVNEMVSLNVSFGVVVAGILSALYQGSQAAKKSYL